MENNILSNTTVRLADLGIPSATFEKYRPVGRGLIVFSGALGSGKSDTVFSLVDEINRERHSDLVLVGTENPYVSFEDDRCTVIKLPLYDEDEFGSSSLLYDTDRWRRMQIPEVVVIDGVETGEALQLALHLADKGVMVFATVLANRSEDVFSTLLSMTPEDERDATRKALKTLFKTVVHHHKVFTGTDLSSVNDIDVLDAANFM